MFLLEAACGLNTRTSRNVLSDLPPQNPFMAISNLAPLVEMAVLPDSSSDDTSCKFGSTQTSLHTSVNSVAVMSRISLCLIEGNPPRGEDSTCSTVKLAPHTVGWDFGGCPAIPQCKGIYESSLVKRETVILEW